MIIESGSYESQAEFFINSLHRTTITLMFSSQSSAGALSVEVCAGSAAWTVRLPRINRLGEPAAHGAPPDPNKGIRLW